MEEQCPGANYYGGPTPATNLPAARRASVRESARQIRTDFQRGRLAHPLSLRLANSVCVVVDDGGRVHPATVWLLWTKKSAFGGMFGVLWPPDSFD